MADPSPVAFITGASSGIGKAIAKRFYAEGYCIAGLAHNEEKLEEVIDHLGGDQSRELAVAADVSNPDQMRRAVDEVLKRWGRIDAVVANAGINGTWAPLDEITPEEWSKTIAVNLTGTFLTLHYCAEALKRRGGSVVIMSSVNGTRMFSNTGATAYSASKAGQVAVAKMLALELAQDQIRVNAICPGWIDTPISDKTERRDLDEVTTSVEYPEGTVPLTHGGPGQPEQVANLTWYLCSEQSSHVTGSVVFIDGAQSLLQG